MEELECGVATLLDAPLVGVHTAVLCVAKAEPCEELFQNWVQECNVGIRAFGRAAAEENSDCVQDLVVLVGGIGDGVEQVVDHRSRQLGTLAKVDVAYRTWWYSTKDGGGSAAESTPRLHKLQRPVG